MCNVKVLEALICLEHRSRSDRRVPWYSSSIIYPSDMAKDSERSIVCGTLPAFDAVSSGPAFGLHVFVFFFFRGVWRGG